MERQYKEIPKESPNFGTFYCPWCATKQTTHTNVSTVYCNGCGRKLTHDGKQQYIPEEAELKAYSDEQLLHMLNRFCPASGAYDLAQNIARSVPDRKHIVFAAAEALYQFEPTSDEGLKILVQMAKDRYYPALTTLYNAFFSEDLKYAAELKTVCKILVQEFGDQTAADTLRTILRKEGQL